MSQPITTGSFSKALWPGVNAWFGEAYREHPLEWVEIFDRNTSNRAYEEDVQRTGTGLMRVKKEGRAIDYDTRRQGFITRYTHVHYALGFVVTEEAYEDDLYDVVAPRDARALGFSARQTQEVVGANVLNKGFDSDFTGGDGKELFATDHPNFSGGEYANELQTPADLSEAAMEQASIDIMKFRDDRGLRISIMPRKLIVPPDLCFEAERILKSTLQNDTANNATNALRSKGIFPEGYVVNHYLTDPDAWFIKTNAPEGLKAYIRKDVTFATDNDFDTSNAKFKAAFRASWGWTDPRGAYGSPGA